MRIEVEKPSAVSGWRWVVVCRKITPSENHNVNTWLDSCGIPFDNVVATYWIKERNHVELFLLRWA